MKKSFFAIFAFIMSIFMGVSVLSGCNLVTIDNEKDMAQIVATVKIDDSANEMQITKQQMATVFLNNYDTYYYAIQSGSYTKKDIFESIIDNLVSHDILIQGIMKEFNADTTQVHHSDKGVWDVERYLTDDEIVDAKYQSAYFLNEYIEHNVYDEDEVTSKDTLADEVRTVPTDATNAEEELDIDAKRTYISQNSSTVFDGIDIGQIGSSRRTAYNRLLKTFEEYGILGDYKNDIRETAYYKDIYENCKESILIEKYENQLKLLARGAVSYSDLSEQYVEMYNAQKIGYSSASAYETALGNAQAGSPLVYSPLNGYGYVYNLLLGVNGTQEALIGELAEDAYAERNAILSTTTVKDLRSTWITSGYDYDNTTKKFTGDYTFNDAVSLPFQGEVTLLKEKTHDSSAEYRIDSVKEFALDEFIDFMDNYLMDKEDLYAPSSIANEKTANDPEYYYKKANLSSVKNYDDKINELLFAFSTDPGSLNTYKGYVISPKPASGQSEKFVKEFAQAGRELLTMGKNSYIIVATTYGYHVMFFSQVLTANSNFSTLEAYLNDLTGTDASVGTADYWKTKYDEMMSNWEDYSDKDFFLYNFASVCINEDTFVEEKVNAVVYQYRYQDSNSKVSIFNDRFADLYND